jgi:hypothetical protein
LIAAVLFLGIYPKPVLSRIEPATSAVAACFNPAFESGPYTRFDGTAVVCSSDSESATLNVPAPPGSP